MAGILTKTIVESPVIRWILHARIRHRTCNDVVFVGDDFIHVKQVKGPGTLEHIATKDDFDARIRAAKAFNNHKEAPDEELFVKIENGSTRIPVEDVPPQCLVLTLHSNDLLFLWLATNTDGTHRFVQQACPMPTFDRILFQPGEYLAIDPQSRAIAVAANEREVVIYSAKTKERIQYEIRTGVPDWCPVSAQRPLQVPGVVQHMEFLIPPLDDQGNEDEDHIILLLIVIDNRKTRAVRIEWHVSSDLHHADVHAGQPLDAAGTVPSLLIPLRNAAFLLVHGNEIKRWKGIVSGSATSTILSSFPSEPSYPGASARRPIWINWCRPRRGQAARSDTDHLYLVREDGELYLVQITLDKVDISNAGSLGCHVGTACASLGDSINPDILAVAGDMSNGSVQSIGSWFTPLDVPRLSRRSWAELEPIETIPNWASVTDMVVSTLPGKSQRTRGGVFVTSCRQPYGAVTELRRGLEASLSAYFEFDGLRSVTDVWALPFTATGHILVLLSSPAGTRLLDISPDVNMESIEEVDGTAIGLDSAHRTLAAGVTSDSKVVQITERGLCIIAGSSANFEDCATLQCDDASSILVAAVDTTSNVAIAAIKSHAEQPRYKLQCYTLHTADLSASGNAQIVEAGSYSLGSEPLCVVLFTSTTSQVIALVATADGMLISFAVELSGSIRNVSAISIHHSLDGPGICDSIAILKSDSAQLAVCGLRDGRLYLAELDPTLSRNQRVITFSQSAVKVSQPPDVNTFAYAMSGADTCRLTWDGSDLNSLCIDNVWISDKQRPELAQGAVVACTHMPPAHLLTSADLSGYLIMISGDEFLVASVKRAPGTVPRQMAVSGTPNRLIYSEQQRSLVCASLKYDVQYFPSNRHHSKPEERRQIWPVIDFLPSRSNVSTFTYDLQPGERVYALLEWSFKLGEDKTYSFILVGGSYTRSNGTQRGRIRFLQPVNRSWEVVDMKEGQNINFDAPVYALALYQDTQIIACIGQNTIVLRFDAEKRKWEQACAPLQLASVGIHVSISPDADHINISTLQDGVVTLSLAPNARDNDEQGSSTQLVVASMAPRADHLLSHVALSTTNSAGARTDSGIVLASTKYGQLLGLDTTSPTPAHLTSAPLLFEAQLPRSLTRLKQSPVRPRWKPDPPPGMSADDILGCAADGSIVGIAVLDDHLWRHLSWLQRLCESSDRLSPLSFLTPPYSAREDTYARHSRPMPIGLRRSRDEVAMRTDKEPLGDGHVDGDVLGRLLEQDDPVGVLKAVLVEVAARDDGAGQWVRLHLEEEMGVVEETVAVLRRALDRWL